MTEEIQRHSVHTLVFRSLKRSHDMFISNQGTLPPEDETAEKLKKAIKAKDGYSSVLDTAKDRSMREIQIGSNHTDSLLALTEGNVGQGDNMALMPSQQQNIPFAPSAPNMTALAPRKAPPMPKPKWHAPWKLYRVLSGHLGWVRCVTVEPGNEWIATGAGDRVIKIWDLASGKLKVSLTGHISTVRGLAVSARHPYLFSCGEDRQVKCWDLEYNKVIRHYHGHLSAVYSLALHPRGGEDRQVKCWDLEYNKVIRHYHGHLSAVYSLALHPHIDVLLTAGRDATARVWDMRTKANVHTLTGHTNTVASVICQAAEPQVITGSHDSTIRLWDLAAGKSMATLTNHKKSVRSLVFHPTLYMFASASPDNIKQWRCPEGNFVQNLSGHNAIVNCLAVNPEGVLVSGGDNGTLHLWDWRTGYNFQRLQAPVQPGSMDSEAGVFAMLFDQSGTRLITAEADKTIKIYKEDETATEESHPVNWRPEILKRRKY